MLARQTRLFFLHAYQHTYTRIIFTSDVIILFFVDAIHAKIHRISWGPKIWSFYISMTMHVSIHIINWAQERRLFSFACATHTYSRITLRSETMILFLAKITLRFSDMSTRALFTSTDRRRPVCVTSYGSVYMYVCVYMWRSASATCQREPCQRPQTGSSLFV